MEVSETRIGGLGSAICMWISRCADLTIDLRYKYLTFHHFFPMWPASRSAQLSTSRIIRGVRTGWTLGQLVQQPSWPPKVDRCMSFDSSLYRCTTRAGWLLRLLFLSAASLHVSSFPARPPYPRVARASRVSMSGDGGASFHTPAALRNRGPIVDFLQSLPWVRGKTAVTNCWPWRVRIRGIVARDHTEPCSDYSLTALFGVQPSSGHILEVASGTGPHVGLFAGVRPDSEKPCCSYRRACSLIPFLYSSGSEPFSSFTWQPTDFDPEMLPFITAEVKARGLRNVKEPVMLVRKTHVLPALCCSSSTWRLNHAPLSCRCSPTDRMCGPILARGHVLDRRPSTASSPSTSSTSRRTSAPVDS